MIYETWLVLIGLLLVLGYCLLLIKRRRDGDFEEYKKRKYRGHIPPGPIPTPRDMPPAPPLKKP